MKHRGGAERSTKIIATSMVAFVLAVALYAPHARAQETDTPSIDTSVIIKGGYLNALDESEVEYGLGFEGNISLRSCIPATQDIQFCLEGGFEAQRIEVDELLDISLDGDFTAIGALLGIMGRYTLGDRGAGYAGVGIGYLSWEAEIEVRNDIRVTNDDEDVALRAFLGWETPLQETGYLIGAEVSYWKVGGDADVDGFGVALTLSIPTAWGQ